MPKNYYLILGIPANSGQQEIKAAYRRLAKEFHPDRFGTENRSPFQDVQEAYSVLNDPVRRRAYDDAVSKARRKKEQLQKTAATPGYPRQEHEPLIPGRHQANAGAGPPGFSRVHGSSSHGMPEPLSRHYSDNEPAAEKPPANHSVVVTLTAEQARRGGHVRLSLPGRVRCPGCLGRGRSGFHECWQCGGAGSLAVASPVRLNYPPGMPDNHMVQISLNRYGLGPGWLTVRFRIRALA